MRIIEIKARANGSHRNQTGNFKTIPDGYAVIPDDIKCENFPFGEIEIEEVKGVMTVTKWIAGVIPEIKEIEQPVGETEQLRADIDFLALMTGVEL